MKVKLCGIRNEKDIEIAINAGADAVGFLVGQVHPSSDFILISTAARLVKLLPPFITPVIVTHLSSTEEIQEIVIKTGINTIQLYGKNSIDELRELKDKLGPSVKLIYATHVIGDKCEEGLEDKIEFVDALILDSYNEEEGKVGGTGLVHDWQISAKLVEKYSIPIMLAGGLNSSNVKNAIKIVKPFGVDANSSLKNEEGFRDFEKCKLFVKNSHDA